MATTLQNPSFSAVASRTAQVPPVTVVHSGARDAYQVALALEESGMLATLVTDLFWPADRPWAQYISALLPASLRAQLQARSSFHIPASKVHLCAAEGALTLLLEKLSKFSIVPQALRRNVMRHADATLGRTAGRLAERDQTALLSYSYYAHDAFLNFNGDGILFQLHPHPASMRHILLAELERHPQCAASLQQEWELALPQADYEHLVNEPASAHHIIAASSFTCTTLVEHGAPPENIAVIPYGVDSRHFMPDNTRVSRTSGKLRLLFVGRINQRKGIQYLLDALSLLNTNQIELTVCGRVVDDLSIFRPFGDKVIIRPDVSSSELLAAYQSADLFVFPSLAEGFGQVLLESLACGLPILSTTRTAAPDLIHSGQQGFIVEPGSSTLLASHIEWALSHRTSLWAMRSEARHTAEHFTWQRFRSQLAATVMTMLSDRQSTQHVSRVANEGSRHSAL